MATSHGTHDQRPIEAAATALATVVALPMTATGEPTSDADLDLARMVSDMDSTIGVVEPVYETSLGIRPQRMRQASYMGSHCPLLRHPSVLLIASCLTAGGYICTPATSAWTLTWSSLVRTTSPQPTPAYGRRDRNGSDASVKLRLAQVLMRRCCVKRSAHPTWSTRSPRSHAAGLRMSGSLRFSKVPERPALPLWWVARTPFALMHQHPCTGAL